MSVSELKKHLKSGKLVIGTERTLKKLKSNKLAVVFLSANCPRNVKDDIMHYCAQSECTVEELPTPNDELGTLCKKPFSVSVAGLLK